MLRLPVAGDDVKFEAAFAGPVVSGERKTRTSGVHSIRGEGEIDRVRAFLDGCVSIAVFSKMASGDEHAIRGKSRSFVRGRASRESRR